MTRVLRRFATSLLLAGSVLGLGLHSPSADAARKVASSIELRDINNQLVTLADFEGQVVLLNFWATWCGPCMVELPHLQKMYDDLKDQGFTVLSVSTDDARDASKVKPLVKAKRLTFPVVLDKDTAVVSQYNPNKILPYTVLIDREGRIAARHQGYNPGDEVKIRAEVEALLAGEDAAQPDGDAASAPSAGE